MKRELFGVFCSGVSIFLIVMLFTHIDSNQSFWKCNGSGIMPLVTIVYIIGYWINGAILINRLEPERCSPMTLVISNLTMGISAIFGFSFYWFDHECYRQNNFTVSIAYITVLSLLILIAKPYDSWFSLVEYCESFLAFLPFIIPCFRGVRVPVPEEEIYLSPVRRVDDII